MLLTIVSSVKFWPYRHHRLVLEKRSPLRERGIWWQTSNLYLPHAKKYGRVIGERKRYAMAVLLTMRFKQDSRVMSIPQLVAPIKDAHRSRSPACEEHTRTSSAWHYWKQAMDVDTSWCGMSNIWLISRAVASTARRRQLFRDLCEAKEIASPL